MFSNENIEIVGITQCKCFRRRLVEQYISAKSTLEPRNQEKHELRGSKENNIKIVQFANANAKLQNEFRKTKGACNINISPH